MIAFSRCLGYVTRLQHPNRRNWKNRTRAIVDPVESNGKLDWRARIWTEADRSANRAATGSYITIIAIACDPFDLLVCLFVSLLFRLAAGGLGGISTSEDPREGK